MGLFWLELPAVTQRLNAKVSGNPAVDWIAHTLQRHFAGRLPVTRCLSLGCGKGALECQLAGLGVFEACDAFDIAPGCIAEAQASAQQAGMTNIHYAVADVNTLSLASARYDLVLGNASIHHVTALEFVFEQVAQALQPEGLFVLNEYIGPSRFQFPPRQQDVIRACWQLLPPECRQPLVTALADRHRAVEQHRSLQWYIRRLIDKVRDGDLRATLQRRLALRRGSLAAQVRFPSARDVMATDPSEAVRSAEIMPLLERYFEIVEFKPLGGTILQFLLADIAGNFRSPEGERLLKMLFEIEDALLETGALQSDFAYIVARPRR
jgi:SAM-dependent methyltransferase